MTILLLFGLFLLLGALQVPVAAAMCFSALAYVLVFSDLPVGIVAQRMPQQLESFPFLAVPLFVFAGNLFNRAGITARIFEFANDLVGHVRGGLAHVNIVASVIFSGMSGVAQADAAGLGTIEIRAMKKAGYNSALSAAVTASSAIIGPIIPPSVIMVIYAVLAGVSVADLFLAGIVPGVLLALALMATVYWLSGKYTMVVLPAPPARKLMRSFRRALPGLLAPGFLVAGLLGGVATPTELGALIVVYGLVLSVVQHELKLRHLLDAARETVLVCGVLMFIVAAAVPFTSIIAFEQIPAKLAQGMLALSENPWIILLMLNVGLLVIGCFLETTAILLVAVPTLLPLVVELGLSPVHFGIILIFNLLIGTVTPPFGVILFIMMDIAKVGLWQLARTMLPFYPALLAMLLALTFLDELSMALPQWVKSFAR